jgi:5-methylcytosine-specific restriction protein A
MARTAPEWRGKTDDTMPPPRVRLRIYDRAGGVCHICKLPIKPGETWHADHVKALIEGGENRETNIAPTHAHCNLAKANGEKARKAKVARTRKKHIRVVEAKQSIQSAPFAKSEKAARRASKTPKPSLPPRLIYQERTNE